MEAESGAPPGGDPSHGQAQDREQAIRYAEDLRRARRPQRTLSERMRRSSRSERQKILVVDDEQYLRTLLLATLDEERYEIVEVSRGAEAVVVAQAERPALILLDVRMPDVDGLEVCRRIRGHPDLKDLPVVMLTGASEQADRRAGLAAGATRYLTKPFSPLELVEVVEELLG